MKVKLDENLGRSAREFLLAKGFDVETVLSQGLCGAKDRKLIDVCRIERRCLVTMDFDFSNPIEFPPDQYAGIVVFKLPKDPNLTDILDCLHVLVRGVDPSDFEGKLRIVSKARIREYSPLR